MHINRTMTQYCTGPQLEGSIHDRVVFDGVLAMRCGGRSGRASTAGGHRRGARDGMRHERLGWHRT